MKKYYLITTTTAIAVAGWYLFPAENHTDLDSLARISHNPEATTNTNVGNTNQNKTATKYSHDVLSSNAEKETTNPEQPQAKSSHRQNDKTQQSLAEEGWQNQTITINGQSDLELETLGNQKPTINPIAQYRIQNEIDQWTLTAGSPVSYSINIADLFDDPDNDLLSTRAMMNSGSLKLSGNSSLLTVAGMPDISVRQQILSVSATDNYSDEGEDTWVTTQFSLPIPELPAAATHPLEGETLYRLETTQNFAGKSTYYEVVYCEAFKFTNQEVFFAASKSKTRCPDEDQLSLIGHYDVEGNTITLTSQKSSFDAQQTWTLKKEYDSARHQDVKNYFVTVHDGKQYESYTMQKNRTSMEKRINGVTGQYIFQFDWFDYLLPSNSDDYLLTQVGNYIFDHKPAYAGPNGETVDSDLNIQTNSQSLRCHQAAHFYENGVLAGQGEYGIEIISTTIPSNPNYNIDCLEYVSNPNTGQISLAFDLAYSPFDEFVAGEVYSYVLKPKPQFADRVEELKLNLTYSVQRP